MYLSRLLLNHRNAQVRKEVAFPYELHRTLLNAYPMGKVQVDRRDNCAVGMLFRLDESPRDNCIVVLVQSKFAPNWGFLDGKTDSRGQPYLLFPSQIKDSKPNPVVTEFDLTKKVSEGQTLAFRLRANPTVKKDRPDEKQGRRVGIYSEEGQIAWLHRKAEVGGFHILKVQVRNDGKIKDERNHLELLSIQFDGLLQVLDPVRLVETVAIGIGSAKGLGFGLLSLAPYAV